MVSVAHLKSDASDPPEVRGRAVPLVLQHLQVRRLLITECIQVDSPVCLTRAITRTMIGPFYTPLSLAPKVTSGGAS